MRPETVKVIFAEDIKPFDYEGDVDGVRVKVTIGFYRNLTRQSELEEATEPQEGEADARASEEAGITVICNDRVVVISDRTTITGWGLANVPKYHPQFRAITGIMLFSCEDASKLPISTTKRDLDTDSDVYRPARNASMDGMKLFVGFTNRWKGNEESVDALLVPDDRIEARTVTLARDEGRAVRGTRYGERQYVPTLPLPARGTRKRRIAFSREVEEVKLLGEALLGNRDARAGDIGVAAWEETLERRGPDE